VGLAELKKTVKKVLTKLPGGEILFTRIVRIFILFMRDVPIRFRTMINGKDIPDPERVYWINPARIVYYTNYCGNLSDNECREAAKLRWQAQSFRGQVFDRIKDKAKAKDGNWDKSSLKFEDILIHKALSLRIHKNVSWEDTEFFTNALTSIESGAILWDCIDKKSLLVRCDYLDSLIKSIKENGFKLNHKITLQGDDPNSLAKHPRMGEEILVNIGRNGEYLFQDGRHRLAIAKILQLNEIPVKVLVRHTEWQNLRMALHKITCNLKNHALEQLPYHPDLADFVHSSVGDDIIFAIQPFIAESESNPKLLDLGAKFGYFCHKFEGFGYDCYGIEPNVELVWIAEKLRIGEGKSFTIIQKSLLEYIGQSNNDLRHYHTVLAFDLPKSIRRVNAWEEFKNWLNSLCCDQIFFDITNFDENETGSEKNLNSRGEFIHFVLESCSLTHSETLLMNNVDKREIVRFYK